MIDTLQSDELFTIYAFGRQLFLIGELERAELVFLGLKEIDKGRTPSRIGLGLIKLEQGLLHEAIQLFREAASETNFVVQGSLGLCAAFISLSEYARARSVLDDLLKDPPKEEELRALQRAFTLQLERAQSERVGA